MEVDARSLLLAGLVAVLLTGWAAMRTTANGVTFALTTFNNYLIMRQASAEAGGLYSDYNTGWDRMS